MKLSKSFFFLFLWLIFFAFFIFTSIHGAYSKKYEHTIVPPPGITQQIHAGELTAGFRLEQPVNWNIDNNMSKFTGPGTLCVNLLLANYMDRENAGTISLSLRAEHFLRTVSLNAKVVRNNLDQQFCFPDISLADVVYKPATLLLEGVDSPPGKAVTAWMTSDTIQGKVRRNGVVLDKSLIFSIDAITESSAKRMHDIVLTILCFLSTSILFWPIKSKSLIDAGASHS